MKVGIIGLSYWGPNLLRNFLAQPDVEKVIGCDLNPARIKANKPKFPNAEFKEDYDQVLKGNTDLVVIAKPVATHYSLAKTALENGKHIWVEKPFTASVNEAVDLIETAEKKI